MNLLGCKDILVQICNYLLEITELIKLEQLSKNHKTIIRKNDWMNHNIILKNMKFVN